jgi:hypothetical protein
MLVHNAPTSRRRICTITADHRTKAPGNAHYTIIAACAENSVPLNRKTKPKRIRIEESLRQSISPQGQSMPVMLVPSHWPVPWIMVGLELRKTDFCEIKMLQALHCYFPYLSIFTARIFITFFDFEPESSDTGTNHGCILFQQLSSIKRSSLGL